MRPRGAIDILGTMIRSDEGSSIMPKRDEPIRVLLVDDHEHVLWGLTKLIDGEHPRMMVAGTAKCIPELRAAINELKIDVVVLDVYLGDDDSLDYLQEVQASGAEVLVLTGSQGPDTHRRALDGGASGVVLKEEPAEVLLREIERVHKRRQAPRDDRAREQDCQSAVEARIAGFLASTTRR